MAKVQIGKFRCPGVFREIETVLCPGCDEEVEFFAGDQVLSCTRCGLRVRRNSASCLDRCPARQSSCYRAMKADQESGEGGIGDTTTDR